MKFLKTIAVGLLAGLASIANAATHAVLPACTNNGDGSTWNCATSSGATGAYNALPVTLTRGDVYYLADGTYPSYTFNQSGTTTVEIRKAQSYDHGPSIGWNTTTMGSAQAVFATYRQLAINSPGLIINGNGQQTSPGCGGSVGSTPTSPLGTPTDCGIKIDNSTCTSTSGNACSDGISDGGVLSGGWTMKYVEILGMGNATSENYMIRADGSTGTSISHIYLHNYGSVCVVGNGSTNIVFDHNYIWRNQIVAGSSPAHGQCFEVGTTSNGGTVSNNVFRDIGGTAAMAAFNVGGTSDSWKFYNNVVWTTPGFTPLFATTDGMVACINSHSCTNLNVSQNTFVNMGNNSSIENEVGGSATVQNNLWYTSGNTPTFGPSGTYTQDHNSFLVSGTSCASGTGNVCDNASSSPFVGWAAGNFNLASDASDWNNRVSLSAPFTSDQVGTTFTTDRGAFQFVTPPPPKTLTKITILPPATGFFISSPTNTGTAQLAPLCTYSDMSTDNCTAAGGVTWFSDNTGMATISSSGLVTGTGTPVPTPANPLWVNIIAYNGTVFGRTQIQINYYTVNCLVTRPERPDSLVTLGTTILLSAVDCSPDSGASSPTINGPGVGDFVAYTTSDPTKATVNTQGEVTATGVGTATITMQLPGITATRNLTIVNPTITSTTYYVREDGGTIKDANVPGGQCDGTLNVALAGSSGGHCAVNNPMYCFTDETSSTTYTGLVHGGDTCLVTPRANGAQYPIVQHSAGVLWVGPNGGAMAIPLGTPSNPTKLLGSNYASCSTDPHHLGNRVAMNSLGQSFVYGYGYETQNVDIECIDFSSGVDCNQGLSMNSLDWACPVGATQEPGTVVDGFTSNFQMKNVRIHGYYTSMDGTPGPGTKWTNVSVEFNALDGTNFDNPYGFTGNRGDGFYADGAQFNFSGFTEEPVKPLAGGSVSRDGAGNLNVTFPSGSIVNYVVGTNLVLAGMTPSDLNGTFPVSSITFNQQTANITGGTIVSYNDGYNSVWGAQFTTSAPPTFTLGAFVNITGASPSFLNGTYEVFSVSSTGFVVAASQYTRPGWTGGTISSGGTASTAISLVATAAGSSETASVLGTASHVTPAHRGADQQDTGYANGDGWGSGNAAMNDYYFTNCQFHRNTQDGLDGLHSNIHTNTVTFCISEGNEGAPVKAGNADYVFHYNNFMDSNAGANMAFDPNLPPEYNQYLSTFFRANDGYGINNGAWSTFITSNNTFEVGQNVFLDDRCNSPSGCTVLPFAKFYFQNNIVLGFNDQNNPIYDGAPPAIYYPEAAGVPNWQWLNNISFNTRNAPSGGSGNLWATDPKVVLRIPDVANLAQEQNALYGNYNVNLTSTSPAIQGGASNIYTPTTDFNHTATTSPNPVVGALNYSGSAPPVVTSVTVLPNPGSVPVGANLNMSCTANFSDGTHSPCSSPVWTDSGLHSSINSTGVVTGVSSGVDTIAAKVGTIVGNATVNVIAPSTYTIHSLGTTQSLGITKTNP